MYFRNDGLAMKCFDKYLKSAVSKYTSTGNMIKALKHISNHHGGTCFILIDHR